MLDVILFAAAGLAAGVVMGLIPGLHPNMVALIIPFIASLGLGPANIIAFCAALGISNTFLDFIPSMLLGAPEPGKELTLLPAHKMLLTGNGYDAVKLAVTGGIGSVLAIIALLPAIIIFIPKIYEVSRPYTYMLLMFIVLMIIFSEKKTKAMMFSSVCFVFAGAIGLLSQQLNIDSTLVLFPIFSGLFGVSTLLLSTNDKITFTKRSNRVVVSSRQTRRAVLFGSAGGIFSGLLPGVGASEITSMASLDKNEKSFLITAGAVTISNTLMAMLAIWLIQKPRSGIAVAMNQLATVGYGEFLLIAAVSAAVAGLSAVVTLRFAKVFLKRIENTDYRKMNFFVVGLIVFMTLAFTGFPGLLLLVTCSALGMFANLIGVRRSILMGVLILPTIIFYLPI